MKIGALIASSLLCLTSNAALADVLWVAPSGAPYSSISQAVQASTSGDVILVQPGTYAGDVVVDGKELWIAATISGEVVSSGRWTVRGIKRAESVVLSGLTVDDTALVGPFAPAFSVQASEGSVVLADCAVRAVLGEAAVNLEGARRVTALRCEFEAGGALMDEIGAPAVKLSNARLAAWGGFFRGGDGWTVPKFLLDLGTRGGVALQLDAGSAAALLGTSLLGGSGGDHWNDLGGIPGDGGHVIQAASGASVYLHAPTLTPGAGGETPNPVFGDPGTTFNGAGAVRFLGNGPAQLHQSQLFARGQETLGVRLRGAPGTTFGLFLQVGAPPYLLDELRPVGGAGLLDIGSIATQSLFALPSAIGPEGILDVLVPMAAVPSNPPVTGAFLFSRSRSGRRNLGAPMPVLAVDCGALLPDCDGSGRADLCELVDGTLADLNGNGVPDDCEPTRTLHVDIDAAPGGDGSSGAPFRFVNDALAAALNGDEVLLEDGYYSGFSNSGVDLGDLQVTIKSRRGPDHCTIDAPFDRRAFLSRGARGNGGLKLEGITFYGGLAGDVMGQGMNFMGGSIASVDSEVTIKDCVFRLNRAGGGGAIAANGGVLSVEGTVFRNNADQIVGTYGGGGAIRCFGAAGRVRLESCLFWQNTALDDGGAIDLGGWELSASRSEFLDNETGGAGGALFVQQGSVGRELVQCVIAGNTAGTEGGGVAMVGAGSTALRHVTLAANQASGGGAGLWVAAGQDVTLSQSIVSHAGVLGGDLLVAGGSGTVLTVERSLLEGGSAAIVTSNGAVSSTGAILSGDPLFVDPVGLDGAAGSALDNNYMLQPGSPAVDAGDNGLVPADSNDLDGDGDLLEITPLDLASSPRINDDPATPDTGIGGPPVVDLGPYER